MKLKKVLLFLLFIATALLLVACRGGNKQPKKIEGITFADKEVTYDGNT